MFSLNVWFLFFLPTILFFKCALAEAFPMRKEDQNPRSGLKHSLIILPVHLLKAAAPLETKPFGLLFSPGALQLALGSVRSLTPGSLLREPGRARGRSEASVLGVTRWVFHHTSELNSHLETFISILRQQASAQVTTLLSAARIWKR